MGLVLLLVLALSLIVSPQCTDTQPCPSSSSPNFDYFLLVQDWPGSWENPAPNYVTDFTLHGLWPNRDDGTWPACCNNSWPFDETQINALLPQMQVSWASDQGMSNDCLFWAHEWNKHGTCAAQNNLVGTQSDYFTTALGLLGSLNITQAFTAAGITPGDSYDADDLSTAIENTYGVTPAELTCGCWCDSHKARTTKSLLPPLNAPQCSCDPTLASVTFCIDTTLTPMACPSDARTRVTRTFKPTGGATFACSGQTNFPDIQ